MKSIIELAREAGFDPHDMSADFTCNFKDIERFAALVRAAALEEAVEVLEFHGFDDAVPYINWAKANPKKENT